MTSPRTVLVTGAAGFVGANLVRRLVEGGHAVHMLLRPETARWRLDDVAADARTVEADLRDEDAVRAVVRSVRPAWIFHLAAHGAYSWQDDARRIFDTNLTGTVNLLDAALETGVGAFVHAGSSSEYGAVDHAPDEEERLDPNSDYGIAKAAATMYCRRRAREADAHVVTLRLYSVYGPWEDPRRLLPRLIACGRQGFLPPLAAPGTARDFVYVDDVVDALLMAAERDDLSRGHILNVGSGTQTTLREAVQTVQATLGFRAEPHWGTGDARPWDTDTWVADIARIRTETGWEPRTSLADGIRATTHWLDSRPRHAARYDAPAN